MLMNKNNPDHKEDFKEFIKKKSKFTEGEKKKTVFWNKIKSNLNFFNKHFIFNEFDDEEVYSFSDLDSYIYKYLTFLEKIVHDLRQIFNLSKYSMTYKEKIDNKDIQ